jgi:hypothetical protein
LILLAVAIFVIVGGAVIAVHGYLSTMHVVVTNTTRERIDAVAPYLPGQQVPVGEIAAGASDTVRFWPRSESGMYLGFRDRSGERTVEIGYVHRLHGFGEGRLVVLVGADSATIRESRRGRPDLTHRTAIWSGRHW